LVTGLTSGCLHCWPHLMRTWSRTCRISIFLDTDEIWPVNEKTVSQASMIDGGKDSHRRASTLKRVRCLFSLDGGTPHHIIGSQLLYNSTVGQIAVAPLSIIRVTIRRHVSRQPMSIRIRRQLCLSFFCLDLIDPFTIYYSTTVAVRTTFQAQLLLEEETRHVEVTVAVGTNTFALFIHLWVSLSRERAIRLH
jgi:hypothetical protein